MMLALTGLAAVPAHAQQAGSGLSGASNPGAASPYIQQRSKANTSFDNPYAPGGIYDPYRASGMLPGGQSHVRQLQSTSAGLDAEQAGANSLNSGSQQSSYSNGRSGGVGRCDSKSFGSGSLAASGSGMNRLGSAGPYSSSSRCGGVSSTLSHGTGKSSSMHSLGGMNRSFSSVGASSSSAR